jgi:hypothetical protein
LCAATAAEYRGALVAVYDSTLEVVRPRWPAYVNGALWSDLPDSTTVAVCWLTDVRGKTTGPTDLVSHAIYEVASLVTTRGREAVVYQFGPKATLAPHPPTDDRPYPPTSAGQYIK